MDTEIRLWLLVIAFTSIFVGLSMYVRSKRAEPPTTLETVVATGWLLLRRIVGFAAALLFFIGAVGLAFGVPTNLATATPLTRYGYAIFLLFMSAGCIWAAIFGAGRRRFEWRDDVELHRKHKKRYGWRW